MSETEKLESTFVSVRDEQASKQAAGEGVVGAPPRAGARQARARSLIITTLYKVTQRYADLGPRSEQEEARRNVWRDGPPPVAELGARAQDAERGKRQRVYLAFAAIPLTVVLMSAAGVLGRLSGMPSGATVSEIALRARQDDVSDGLSVWLLLVVLPITAVLAGLTATLQSLGGLALVLGLGVVFYLTWGG
jgi:hypothetical protein